VVTAFDKPLSIEEVPVPEATVAFPIIAYLAAKQKAETLFASWKDWLIPNNRTAASVMIDALGRHLQPREGGEGHLLSGVHTLWAKGCWRAARIGGADRRKDREGRAASLRRRLLRCLSRPSSGKVVSEQLAFLERVLI
jgi:hypothetical protein